MLKEWGRRDVKVRMPSLDYDVPVEVTMFFVFRHFAKGDVLEHASMRLIQMAGEKFEQRLAYILTPDLPTISDPPEDCRQAARLRAALRATFG